MRTRPARRLDWRLTSVDKVVRVSVWNLDVCDVARMVCCVIVVLVVELVERRDIVRAEMYESLGRFFDQPFAQADGV